MQRTWNQTSGKCWVRSFALKLLRHLLTLNVNANMLANLLRSSRSGNPFAHEVTVLHFWSVFGTLKPEKTFKSVWNKNFGHFFVNLRLCRCFGLILHWFTVQDMYLYGSRRAKCKIFSKRSINEDARTLSHCEVVIQTKQKLQANTWSKIRH